MKERSFTCHDVIALAQQNVDTQIYNTTIDGVPVPQRALQPKPAPSAPPAPAPPAPPQQPGSGYAQPVPYTQPPGQPRAPYAPNPSVINSTHSASSGVGPWTPAAPTSWVGSQVSQPTTQSAYQTQNQPAYHPQAAGFATAPVFAQSSTGYMHQQQQQQQQQWRV
eukprot:NODE_2836_length_1030_cov_29.720693_g419_i1.p2 GENE.NODE_2836_length_1030_cov_29.720693_g419_i1~~NODE_2836_length_1030_cov_29.720693_g419_i1.p2  ORF type:complete len:165 (+),score=25.54 NODE_2836_length_1030_cov_29.720693_g419_i1:452-946(+)